MVSGETASWEDSERHRIAKSVTLLYSFQAIKYANVALLAILVYDHCLTFGLERTRIWSLRWKMPKILFMINRYLLPPIFFFEGMMCYMWDRICDARIFTQVATFPAMVTVELMLILRVLALYENSKYMARYFVIQLLVQMILFLVLTSLILPKTRSIAGREVFTGCLLVLPYWSYLCWTLPLIIESILVVLSVHKCRKYGAFSPTTKLLVRDSVVYFAIITAVLIFNLFYSRHNALLSGALALPTNILASIAAARLSMNIRAITMNRAISTLAEQSRVVPSLIFRSSEGASHRSGETEITEERHEDMLRQDSSEDCS